MNQNQIQPQPIRKSGSVSFTDDKIRVSYAGATGGQQSVLFEDVSSIEVKTQKIPNLLLICVIIGISFFIGTILMFNDSIELGGGLMVVGAIIAYIIGSQNTINWDDVIIETRGGKLIEYSVNEGEGGEQMQLIEDAKRERTGK